MDRKDIKAETKPLPPLIKLRDGHQFTTEEIQRAKERGRIYREVLCTGILPTEPTVDDDLIAEYIIGRTEDDASRPS